MFPHDYVIHYKVWLRWDENEDFAPIGPMLTKT